MAEADIASLQTVASPPLASPPLASPPLASQSSGGPAAKTPRHILARRFLGRRWRWLEREFPALTNGILVLREAATTLADNRHAASKLAMLRRVPPLADLPRSVTMLVPDTRIDRRVLLQGRTLAAAGVRVTVIAAPYPGPDDLDRAAFPELEIVRVDTGIMRPPGRRARPGKLAHRDWKKLYFYHGGFLSAAIRHPADIYVAHDLPVLPAVLFAASRHNAGVFYDAHELYPEQVTFSPEEKAGYDGLEREATKFVDRMTTVNHSIAAEMAQRYGIATPGVILNAPDTDGRAVPVPRCDLLRTALNIPASTRILLFQGGLSPHRNLETLVAAMALVTTPDLILVLMGPGDMGGGTERQGLLAQIAESRGILGTKVLLHPAVTQERLLDYTASADAGIIPYPAVDLNTTFCTPNKLFEYFCAGLPILANDLPELRRYVLGMGAGMVHAMDSEMAIAAAIDEFFRQDLAVFRASVAANAEKMVWRSQTGVLLDLYRDYWKGRV